MPGRPKSMARKIAELESLVLETHRQLDAATPTMHVQARGRATSGAQSPWSALDRANCRLVTAVVDLGDHNRKAAGIEEPGPIREALGDAAIAALREAAGPGRDSTALPATLPDDLPERASIQRDVEWVAANLHDPSPALDKAPSRTAVGLWVDARRDERLRRDFWSILLAKRMSPGDRKPGRTGFAEDRQDDTDAEEQARHAELMRRLGFGPRGPEKSLTG